MLSTRSPDCPPTTMQPSDHRLQRRPRWREPTFPASSRESSVRARCTLSEEPTANILDHLQGRPLDTDTDTVDAELPLTLDEFDTEVVGTFVHSVLTTAVQNGVSATALSAP